MIKPFLAIVGALFIMLLMISIHYLFFDDKSVNAKLSKITAFTYSSRPSWSVSYYEPRILLNRSTNIVYPEMMPINRMDFVYAK